jgi:hypothetical protein
MLYIVKLNRNLSTLCVWASEVARNDDDSAFLLIRWLSPKDLLVLLMYCAHIHGVCLLVSNFESTHYSS